MGGWCLFLNRVAKLGVNGRLMFISVRIKVL